METKIVELSNTNWQIFYYIATYIISLVAVLSLYLSIKSSRKTAEALTTVQKGFASLTEPLIKVVGHEWLKDSDKISCQTPPIGILIFYKNMSNVPVLIEEPNFTVHYGEKLLNDVITKIQHKEDGYKILAPGETMQAGTTQKELFQKHLCTPKNPLVPPNLIVEFKTKFISLSTREEYTYSAKIEVFFNCEQPDFHSSRTIFENLDKNT